MVWWMKVTATKLDNLKFDPLHGGRREPILTSCHLITTPLLLYTLMPGHTHIQKKMQHKLNMFGAGKDESVGT